jgi:drug/metabolite transporter (DMT)-like permease
VLPADPAELGAVLVIGVVFTGIATLVYAALLRHVTAQVAGLLTFLEPVTGILIAAALLEQEIGAATAVGALLVIVAGAVAIVTGPAGVRVAEAPAGVGSGSP